MRQMPKREFPYGLSSPSEQAMQFINCGVMFCVLLLSRKKEVEVCSGCVQCNEPYRNSGRQYQQLSGYPHIVRGSPPSCFHDFSLLDWVSFSL